MMRSCRSILHFRIRRSAFPIQKRSKNFDTLKAVVEDMTKHKDELGIQGVFGSTSFAPGEDWRWQTHLMNLPIYYEYRDKDVDNLEEIEFTYNENF